jgi:hypothetical protein
MRGRIPYSGSVDTYVGVVAETGATAVSAEIEALAIDVITGTRGSYHVAGQGDAVQMVVASVGLQ